MTTTLPDVTHLEPDLRADVERVAAELARVEAGEIDEEAWKRFRLRFGIYGQRQRGRWQMVRVKVPYGGLRPHQLHRVADLADEFGRGVAHVTTRQDLQVHWIQRENLVPFLVRLAEVGLTSREACGNTVRNVTACPLAGIHPHETFDVTPYALATARHFLRHAAAQDLPRKFKIAFEGCPESCTGPGFHDIGAVAAIRDGRRGFKLWVGGGLGNTPRPATLLEDFTPEEELLRTCEALVRVFDQIGERKNRNRARMKFAVGKVGWTDFRAMVLGVRRALPKHAIPASAFDEAREEPPEPIKVGRDTGVLDFAYFAWRRANVVPQKQAGYAAVNVLLPLGDVSSDRLRAVAKLSAVYGEGRIRATQRQNLLLRWVRTENLPAVYRRLREIGLAETGAERVNDITACPGADTCALAFTATKGLATALRESLRGLGDARAAAERLTVKISGCPNSCGQHHIADIGLYGSNKRDGARDLPAYNVLLGGSARDGRVDFGIHIARIPARRVPEAVAAVARLYAAERYGPLEPFFDFVRRIGKARFAALLAPFEQVDPADESVARDWGQEGAFAVAANMQGECAS